MKLEVFVSDLRAFVFGAAGSAFGLTAVLVLVGWKVALSALNSSAGFAAWAQAIFIAGGIVASIKVGRDALNQAQTFREQVQIDEDQRRRRERADIYEQTIDAAGRLHAQLRALGSYTEKAETDAYFKIVDFDHLTNGVGFVLPIFDAIAARHILDAPIMAAILRCKMAAAYAFLLIKSRKDFMISENIAALAANAEELRKNPVSVEEAISILRTGRGG